MAVKTPVFLILFVVLFLRGFSLSAQDTINRTDSKGLKQGNWKKKDANGILKYEGRFKDDKPFGTFKYYFQDGKIKAINDFKDQGKVAYSKLFFETGELMATGKFVGEKKDSTWTYFDKKGVKISEEHYKDFKKDGIWRTYYLNGKVNSETPYEAGIINGIEKEYYDNGSLKKEWSYKNGIIDGICTIYHSNGQIEIQGKYVNDLKEGTWLYYNDNGTLRIKEEYSKGILKQRHKINGTFTENYPDGITQEIVTYKNGKKEGPFKEYYDEGKWIKVLKKSEDGVSPDEYVEELEGLKLKREGNYLNGKLEGKVITYSANGKIEKTEIYKDGKVVK